MDQARKQSAFEYFSSSLHMEQDGLSELLESSGITLKEFAFQSKMPSISTTRICGDTELIYILSGEGILTIDGTTYQGFANDLFVIPKYSVCSFASNSGETGANYYIHFEQTDPIAAEQCKKLLGGPLIHLKEDPLLLQCYRWLELFYTQGMEGGYLAAQCLLKMILIRVIQLSGNWDHGEESCRNDKQSDSQYQVLQACVKLILERHGVISVQEICGQLYVSPNYVRRIFGKLMNRSPLAFIRSVRIREAEILLLTTNAPISAIAVDLGFSSPYHFSNEFRKYHSVSPSMYRKLGAAMAETDASRRN